MKKILIGIVFIGLSSALVVGCGNFGPQRGGWSASRGSTSANVTVEIGPDSANYGVNPLVISPGTSVTWINDDSREHSATSDTGAFDSGSLPPSGGSYSFTFSKPGSFPYHSATAGDRMTSRIEVRPTAPQPTTTVAPGDPSYPMPGPIPTNPSQCKQCQQQQKPVPKPTKPLPRPLPTAY